jgi:hypothetical protein
MSRRVRKACDDFTKTTTEYLPTVSPELILDIRKAEKDRDNSKIIQITYKQETPFMEDPEGRGYEKIEIRGNTILIRLVSPSMKDLIYLSKDKNIKSISRATWVP